MKYFETSENKTLKLTNVLIKRLAEEDLSNFEKAVEQMENYIKSKGYQPLGPLVQYTTTNVNENGELDVIIKFMRQVSNYINHVEPPYSMESVIRIKDCMYVRYTGPESKIKYAYDKINLMAFEEDIELKGDSYTVFVNQIDDNIVADIFMERAKDE
jgi:uncharacterized protein YecE (DUF72 family)